MHFTNDHVRYEENTGKVFTSPKVGFSSALSIAEAIEKEQQLPADLRAALMALATAGANLQQDLAQLKQQLSDKGVIK